MNAIVELFLINDLRYKVTPKIVPGSSHIVFKSPFGSLKSIKMEYFLTISIIKWRPNLPQASQIDSETPKNLILATTQIYFYRKRFCPNAPSA